MVDPNWSVEQALRNADAAAELRKYREEEAFRFRERQTREQYRYDQEQKNKDSGYSSPLSHLFYERLGKRTQRPSDGVQAKESPHTGMAIVLTVAAMYLLAYLYNHLH